MAVAEPVNVYLDVGLGVRTEALWWQVRLELEGPGTLRVGRDGGRLHGGLRMRLWRRHGGFLSIRRVGGADGGGGLGVQSSVVWRTELICQRHARKVFKRTRFRSKNSTKTCRQISH